MNPPIFDWDDANLRKIAAHSLTHVEVEAAFMDPYRRPLEAEGRSDIWRSAMIGATDSGRVLHIIFTVRRGIVRVVTAFPARPRIHRAYLEGLPP